MKTRQEFTRELGQLEGLVPRGKSSKGVIRTSLESLGSNEPISPRIQLAALDVYTNDVPGAPSRLLERAVAAGARSNFPYGEGDPIIQRNMTENGYPRPDYKALSQDAEAFLDEKGWIKPGEVVVDAGSGPLGHFGQAVKDRGKAKAVYSFDPLSESENVLPLTMAEASKSMKDTADVVVVNHFFPSIGKATEWREAVIQFIQDARKILRKGKTRMATKPR